MGYVAMALIFIVLALIFPGLRDNASMVIAGPLAGLYRQHHRRSRWAFVAAAGAALAAYLVVLLAVGVSASLANWFVTGAFAALLAAVAYSAVTRAG